MYNNAIAYVGATQEIQIPDQSPISFSKNIANNMSAGDALDDLKNNFNSEVSLKFNLYGCPEVSLNLDPVGSVFAPQNFIAHPAASDNPIQLTWTAVPGAIRYVIERNSNHSSPAKGDGFYEYVNLLGSATGFPDWYVNAAAVFKYRIYALDASGRRSGFSAVDSACTYLGQTGARPVAPTGFQVLSAGSNSVTVGWTGVANANSYNLKRSLTQNDPNAVTIANTSGTSFRDYNLIAGTYYYYSVSAVNQYGQSVNSGSYKCFAKVNIGSPYLQSASTYVDDNGTRYPQIAQLSWSSYFNDEIAFEAEWALRFPDKTCGAFSSITPLGTNIDRYARSVRTSPVDLTGTLMPFNTDVAFQMRSTSKSIGTVNYNYKSAISNIVTLSTDPGPSVPPVPGAVTVAPSGPEQLAVTWTYGSTSNTSFEIYYKPNGGAWQTPIDIDNVKTCPIPRLQANKQYQVCVRAYRIVSGIGRSYSKFSSIGSGTTSANLAAPSGLMQTSVTESGNYNKVRGQISLKWTDNSSCETGYYIERAAASSGPWTQIGSVVDWVNYTDSKGLADGTSYYYRVRAYSNVSGTKPSAYSSPTLKATTLFNIASGKTASASGAMSGYQASYGNDNKTSTRWSASKNTGAQWWMVDLGATRQHLYSAEVMWEKSGSGNTYTYIIETSKNNATWDPAVDKSGNTSTAQTQALTFNDYVQARYVRITVNTVPSKSYASFFEFRVFGE
jgi:fibronectin type 3 domain-containing protein